jgi:glycosyltransferase involved in cell wall biosynthesis
VTLEIAIDAAAMSSPQPGGYRTYITNLVSALRRVAGPADYNVVVDRPIPWEASPGWRVSVLGRLGSLGFIWREQYAVPRYLRHTGADLLHCAAATGPLRSGVPLVATLYDTIEFGPWAAPIHNPRRWAMHAYRRFVQTRIAARAIRILTISDYSRTSILAQFGVPAERVVVAHLAASPAYRSLAPATSAKAVEERFGVRDYVLGIASAAPHKNTRGLLEAYAQLPPALRSSHPLVLVCTHAAVEKAIAESSRRLSMSTEVVCIPGAVDEDLCLLYNAAGVFAFPSFAEGFGLPPLEAMACGTPVVASNAGSLPEVLGDAAVLVSPGDIRSLADAIAQILCSPSHARELGERGLRRARTFSWDETARRTQQVYEEAAVSFPPHQRLPGGF